MKMIVTGAAGFIGSHLCEALIEKGHEVTGIDCFLDYYPRRIKESNLERLRSSERFHFLEQNLLDVRWPQLLEGAGTIFHLAAQAGVRASWSKNFLVYTKNNIEATQLMLEESKQSGLRRFVYASTSSVYGDIADIPMREESLLKPVSPYGVTKLAAESLCYLYWKNFGVPCVSLRYFTVFGPRQRPDMAFYRFFLALLQDRPITIFEDGNQTRDFTFVQDIVEGTIQSSQQGEAGKCYNLGGGHRISVHDVLKMIGEVTGIVPRVVYAEKQKGDMRHTFASTEAAAKDFEYVPRTSLREGLTAQYMWLKDLYEKGLAHQVD